MSKPNTKQVPFRLTEEKKNQFVLCCEYNKASMNAVLNKAVDAYISKYHQRAIEGMADKYTNMLDKMN